MKRHVIESTTNAESGRLMWVLFIVFVFVAFQFMLFAVVRQGDWFVLLAPGVVCAARAQQLWRGLNARRASA